MMTFSSRLGSYVSSELYRYHSPVAGTIVSQHEVEGPLFSVSADAVIFKTNLITLHESNIFTKFCGFVCTIDAVTYFFSSTFGHSPFKAVDDVHFSSIMFVVLYV